MKRRTAFTIGFVFALLLGWTWIQRPNQLGREFYKAGIRPVFVQTVTEFERTEYEYNIPKASEDELIDVFDRAGFHSDQSGPLAKGGLNMFYKSNLPMFWRPKQVVMLYPGKVNMIRTSFKLD